VRDQLALVECERREGGRCNQCVGDELEFSFESAGKAIQLSARRVLQNHTVKRKRRQNRQSGEGLSDEACSFKQSPYFLSFQVATSGLQCTDFSCW